MVNIYCIYMHEYSGLCYELSILFFNSEEPGKASHHQIKSSTSVQSCDSSIGPSRSWPMLFPINQSMFRKPLWEALQRSESLNKTQRGQLTDGLYEECVKYRM